MKNDLRENIGGIHWVVSCKQYVWCSYYIITGFDLFPPQ